MYACIYRSFSLTPCLCFFTGTKLYHRLPAEDGALGAIAVGHPVAVGASGLSTRAEDRVAVVAVSIELCRLLPVLGKGGVPPEMPGHCHLQTVEDGESVKHDDEKQGIAFNAGGAPFVF